MGLGTLVGGAAPACAAEVPLSRASFDRALAEGGRCKRLSDGDYVVLRKKSTEPVLAAAIEATLAELFQNDTIDLSFVTVRLRTPYTEVTRKACEARLTNGPLDVEELWSTVQAATTVSLMVETKTSSTANDWSAREDEATLGVPPTTTQLPGPKVTEVSLRRGADRSGPVTQPVSLVGGAEYVFPATALQGEGPFYALVHAEEPRLRLELKLKRSVLARP